MATAQARLREFLPNARELALLFAARGLACVAAWESGFRALSDDDYARISIAQGFAQMPRLDPTGTSWLPAPFWAYGALFRVFGHGLEVARAGAIAAGLAATVLVFVAARVLGARPASALWGAGLSCVLLPYSALLGLTAVPEVPCAALILFGAATLARPGCGLRALGALALSAACLSRYEAWPVAVFFLGFCLYDALKQRNALFVGCGLLAVAGAACWLEHGRLQHGHALFFVARVTSYRRALGGVEASTWQRLISYPALLLLMAPSLWLTCLSLWLATRQSKPPDEWLRDGRVRCTMLALLIFLMVGSLHDGVPTHHAARVLLPIWFYVCVAAGPRAALLTSRVAVPLRPALFLAMALPLLSLVATPHRYEFANRSAELEAGTAARQFTTGNLAIDTPDYGYTAVQAAFGTPISTRALDEHDPRHPDPDPFASPEALERAMRERSARFALVTSAHAPLLTTAYEELWRNEAFVLFAWKPSPKG